MAISARELEEDEAKIDNLLHKVIRSCNVLEELNKQIGYISDQEGLNKEYVLERQHKIGILIKTISELVLLADDIDIEDKEMTEELEKRIREKIGASISGIKEMESFAGNSTN